MSGARADHTAMADGFIAATGASVIERVELPARAGQLALPPQRFREGAVGNWFESFLGGGGMVYRHQAEALAALEQDHVVLSTGTASGKSLVFMAHAIAEMTAGQGRVLMLYPQLALIGDQLTRWQGELARAGLPSSLVGVLNGDVPTTQRNLVLDTARIVLATPDVLHAWLMPMVSSSGAQRFLTETSLIAIDEAHVLEGVFGTNFALFFRRLQQARLRAAGQLPLGSVSPLRVLATSATLSDPVGHLELVTGLPFVGIGEEANGAPSEGTTVLHIEGPDRGAPAERAVADAIGAIYELMPSDAAVIAFANSRQGVERIARSVDRPDFAPYRQGYSPAERREIEAGLRSGRYRGAGATSALELGIDMRQFAYGLNLGLTDTFKSLRQRVGRVGRTRPGLFIVIGPRNAYSALGTTLEAALTGSVEPSPVYTSNPIIQFQHACCFLREGAEEDTEPRLAGDLHWPEGFEQALSWARPGNPRPRELDDIAAVGLDSPHHSFSMRSMPGVTFALKHAHTGDVIGSIDHQKAIRETYPGGTYYHRSLAYRVIEWRSSSFENAIRILPQRGAQPTQPLLRCQVGASIQTDALIEDRLLTSDAGALFECQLRVVESVEGYRIGKTTFAYRELREKDRRLSRRQREYQTTGVVIRIAEPWFAGTGDHQMAARRSIAAAIKSLLVHEYGIAPSELQTAHTGIALHSSARSQVIDDGIAVFDTVSGGLRLAAPLYPDFAAILARLDRAAVLAGTEAPVSAGNVERLLTWHSALVPGIASAAPLLPQPGKILVYAPGSRVAIRIRGQSVEREIFEPQFVAIGDEEKLMYRYDAGGGASGWVADDQVMALGNDWQRASWDPLTNELLPLGDAA